MKPSSASGEKAPQGSGRDERANDGASDTVSETTSFALEANVSSMLADHTPLYTLSSGYHESIY